MDYMVKVRIIQWCTFCYSYLLIEMFSTVTGHFSELRGPTRSWFWWTGLVQNRKPFPPLQDVLIVASIKALDVLCEVDFVVSKMSMDITEAGAMCHSTHLAKCKWLVYSGGGGGVAAERPSRWASCGRRKEDLVVYIFDLKIDLKLLLP